MNIDLLFTAEGKAGFIASENLVSKAVGVIVEAKSGIASIEYVDMDFLEMNIPIEQDYIGILDYNPMIQLGAVIDGHIAQAYQVPLMFSDDPYRNKLGKMPDEKNPLSEFEYFVKSCVAGQPVHREDLGNEDTMGCVLGDSSPSSLEFAPHLARRHALEIKPQLDLSNLPSLGLGGGGSTTHRGGGQQDGSQGKDGKKK